MWHLASATQLHERAFDTSGRLVRYRLGPNLRDITYDAADRITSYTHYAAAGGAAQPALDQSFGYDAAGRLTTITTASASWTISYDASGNRTGVTLNGTTSTYTTEATSNRLSSTANPARSFTYDPAGNTTASTAVNPYTATYNLAGRLATLAKAGVTTTYSVDGQGRRVRKFSNTGAASTVIFVYDQGGQILGEYDSTGKAIREYVWMGSTPVAVFTPDPAAPTGNPIVYTIHIDHLDTPRIVLDKNGAIRWRWLAEPFGTTAPETNPSSLGAFTFHLRFPGQYFDQESGLHYNYFRDYDSTIGRYTQSDPIGLDGGVNTYTYVENQPTKYTDPLGLETYICTRPLGGGDVQRTAEHVS
jgi:RHS repeat-associated protein